jgi:hypothetical protein
MLEKSSSTKVCLQKVEGCQRRRGALGPLLFAVVALASWLDAGAVYALDVPSDAALQDDAELLPVTLNPPVEGLVFGADENCISLARTIPGNAAANVQMDAAGPENGTQMEPEDRVLEPTASGACVPLATFAAAGEPVFAASAASAGFGFNATLGQLVLLIGMPAAIGKLAETLLKSSGGNGPFIVLISPKPGGGFTITLPGRGPIGGPGGPPAPVPEPVSTAMLIAGAAMVGRAVLRRASR